MHFLGIKPPQKRKTDENKNSYCYKYLKSLYYLIKWVFKMNMSESNLWGYNPSLWWLVEHAYKV
jgi:hypothetical protein